MSNISIPMFQVNMSPSASDAVAKVLESGMIGEGPVVQEFEDRLTEYFGVPTIALNSCTSALTLALRMAEVKGHQVLTSPFTFPATSCAIQAAGGDIHWGKVDRDTMCLDVGEAIKTISACPWGYRAVVITLVGGMVPIGLEELQELLARHRIPLIFDAAHAFGTFYKDKHIAQYADYCCFSFQSIKQLTTGDGGAITIRDPWNVQRAERLKWFGMSRDTKGKSRLEHQMNYSIPEWGYKFHMNDISAAIGLANWARASEEIGYCRGVAARYNILLKDTKWVEPLKSAPESRPSYWVYGFHFAEKYVVGLVQHLEANGIAATPMWKWNHEHATFPSGEDEIEKHSVVFIPCGSWVTDKDQHYIVDVIKEYVRENL